MDIVKPLFDAEWYLKAYPDVAAAGAEPWPHFVKFGRSEGRQPCAIQAFELEQKLWFDNDHSVLAELEALAGQQDTKGVLACWVLARWYGSFGQYDKVIHYLTPLVECEAELVLIGHHGPLLLLFSAYYEQGMLDKAHELLSHTNWCARNLAEHNDRNLACAMLHEGSERLANLQSLFVNSGLTGLSRGQSLDTLEPQLEVANTNRSWWKRQPRVSVIVPCYNAEKTIGTALQSLLQQSWPSLEIIIIDDASTDDSAAVVEAFCVKHAANKRVAVKLLRQAENQGAYAARNAGLQAAKGKFITTHDSDDWSHPQKIEKQVQALMRNSGTVASVSHWVRCTDELVFGRWRAEPNWIYRNVSSLMFDRKVLGELGFLDRVSVNADTEYYERIIQRFGAEAVIEVLPGVPLSLGRHDPRSLSQSSDTHLRTQFCGLRRNYMEAARTWHGKADNLYLDFDPDKRAFAVPASMLRGNDKVRMHNARLLLTRSDLFDRGYYLERYPDIGAAGIDPLQHYLFYGQAEGRDPSALFSTSGYRLLHDLPSGESPVLHALEHVGLESGLDEVFDLHLKGFLSSSEDKESILICAHSCSGELFGAERSLLDVLRALAGEYNVVVTLPSALSADYVQAVRECCADLHILPYRWWQRGRALDAAILSSFGRLVERYSLTAVYVNTLTLWEPLLAARDAGVPGIMHVRELVEHDPDLCAVLGGSAEEVRAHVLGLADVCIANSEVVSRWVAADESDDTDDRDGVGQASPADSPAGRQAEPAVRGNAVMHDDGGARGSRTPPRVYVVPNMVELDEVPRSPWLGNPEGTLTVGMLSSNLPKKGLYDFVDVARIIERNHPGKIKFKLFGPVNAHVKQLMLGTQGLDDKLPANLEVCGYSDTPETALAQLDLVLNFSHFQESFGRSVLEAMAASRPVVCYQWGALEALVDDKVGRLVPFKDVQAAAQAIVELANDHSRYAELCSNARARAQSYRFKPFKQRVLRLFTDILDA